MPHAHPVRRVLAVLLACAVLLPTGLTVLTSAPAASVPILAGDDTKTGGGTG